MSTCASQPMILRSPDVGETVRVNPELRETLGLSAEELASRTALEWIHPDDRTALAQAIADGKGCARARHETATGAWVPFEWKVTPDSQSTALLGLLERPTPSSTRLDSTSSRSTHESLEETLVAMARIVESKNPGMRCSILLLDETRESVTVGAGPSLPAEYNAAVEGLRIGPRVGSCGTAAFWNIPVVVENIAEDPLWEQLRDAAKVAGVAACWSQPITSTTGDVLGAMALYNNVALAPKQYQMDGLAIAARMVGLAVERNRLEGQLRQAAKMEALGVLAGGIAHDFNNLLVAILGNAELIGTTLPQHAETQSMLKEIVAASLSATELCNQMLAYAGRGALRTEVLETNALVRELGDLLKVALSKKATLVFKLCGEPLGILADSSQMRQVVMNLITNASDAIGNHEGQIILSTSTRQYSREELGLIQPDAALEAGEYVLLSVQDTGCGMKPETKNRIFDPFFSTKSNGRGLGLAAVQGIVRAHEGAIFLETESGLGTTFHVLIPRQPLAHASRHSGMKTHSEARGACILVVDDELYVRSTVSKILASAGYDVLLAEDGERAIEVFRENSESIDCVILDLSMPKLDGAEAFHELRKIRSDVKVILSSGFTEQQIMDRFHDRGLTGVIQKPARMATLLSKLADALNRTTEESPAPEGGESPNSDEITRSSGQA